MSDHQVQVAPGVSLQVSVTGSGPPLLWVAGLGDDRSSWADQIPFFAQDYTCISYDNRGCGASDTPPGPYRIEQLADDLAAVLDALQPGPVAAIGSSMGGATCQQWAARRPDQVSALALTNTWAASDTFTRMVFDHWIGLAERGQAGALAESMTALSYSGDHVCATQPAIPLLTGLDGIAAAAHACRDHDSRQVLDQIHAPTLVIAGTHDALTRPRLSRELADAIPGARLESIEAGHMLFQEQPVQFNHLLGSFLRENQFIR